VFCIGTFSGRALDAGIFKPVFILGILLQVVGIFTTSVCTKYWQLFLSQGVCMGIGNGLQFCPTVAILAHYFTKHRSVAIGIAASGTASGGMVFPAIVKAMLPTVGFGWTVRTIGFLNLAIGIMTVSVLKPRLPPRKSGPLVEWSAFKEIPYLLYLLGMFLNFWGLYFGFYYVSDRLRTLLVQLCSEYPAKSR
jgi:MFS family permease